MPRYTTVGGYPNPDPYGEDVEEEKGACPVSLSPAARAAVEKIMDIGKIPTMQEAIRRAIGDELFLLNERKDGWKVWLKKGNRYREVTWPDNV